MCRERHRCGRWETSGHTAPSSCLKASHSLGSQNGSRNFGNKNKAGGGGVDMERTPGPCHSVFLGFFLLGETHTVQGHTSLARCGRWWEEKQWEQRWWARQAGSREESKWWNVGLSREQRKLRVLSPEDRLYSNLCPWDLKSKFKEIDSIK